MSFSRALCVVIPLAFLTACSGGGGPSTTATWEKFRADSGNNGAGGGAVATVTPLVRWTTAPLDPTPCATPCAISSSPAIALDGTIYVGTEGGTLAAVNADGTIKWTVTTCAQPTPGACENNLPIGPLLSSPAVSTSTLNNQTSILIGSTSGYLFVFLDTGTAVSCTACFKPSTAAGDPQITSAAFVSSPNFTLNPVTDTIGGIFIGATLTTGAGQQGKLYAVNNDGSLRWEFPRPGATPIGPVTSSPALGTNNTVYFTADETLYSLTSGGVFLWQKVIGHPVDVQPFSSSPVSGTSTYVTTSEGEIAAINPDGSFGWRVMTGQTFVASMALGELAGTTPSPTATPTATPLVRSTPTTAPGATQTPTTTPTPLHEPGNLFAVSTSGQVFVVPIAFPVVTPLQVGNSAPTPTPVAITGPVTSSPALSSDGFLIFGDSAGLLHAVNTSTGSEPPGWPVPLGGMVTSSPAIAADGTIYVGSSDGHLYAVKTQ